MNARKILVPTDFSTAGEATALTRDRGAKLLIAAMNFDCPHCGQVLLNDGQTAGQVVACPFCRRQIQMPGPSAPPLVATLPIAPSYRRKPPAKRKTDPTPYIVATVALALCIGIGGVGIWAITAQESNSPAKNVAAQKPPRPKAKTRLQGQLLFIGLGTGLGSALVTDESVVPMELGHLSYRDREFEDFVGARGLARLGVQDWQHHVEFIVQRLIQVFHPDDVVLGGGNAKKLPKMPAGCRLGTNAHAFVGAFRMWEQAE